MPPSSGRTQRTKLLLSLRKSLPMPLFCVIQSEIALDPSSLDFSVNWPPSLKFRALAFCLVSQNCTESTGTEHRSGWQKGTSCEDHQPLGQPLPTISAPTNRPLNQRLSPQQDRKGPPQTHIQYQQSRTDIPIRGCTEMYNNPKGICRNFSQQ